MRNTYCCGGKGRHGRPKSGICASCGRKHPKGKKQKQAAILKGWESCKSVSARKRKDKEIPADKKVLGKHQYKSCITCGNKKTRHTIEKQNYCRNCAA